MPWLQNPTFLMSENLPRPIEAVDRGAQVAFLLNPVDVDVVMKVAISGEVMPQKSTDFYPKLLSGITMYRVAE